MSEIFNNGGGNPKTPQPQQPSRPSTPQPSQNPGRNVPQPLGPSIDPGKGAPRVPTPKK